MLLRPVSRASSPSYPEGPAWRRGLLGWTRRVLVTAGAVATIGLAGCYGMTPYPSGEEEVPEDVSEPDPRPEPVPEPEPDPEPEPIPEPDPLPEPEPCEYEYRLSGMMMPTNYFTCSWDDPSPTPHELPLYLGGGELCPGGAALAYFDLTEAETLRFGLADWSETVVLFVLDESGRVLTSIGPGESCVELDLEPGRVGLSAEAVRPTEDFERYFEFSIDIVGEES